MPGFDGTGPHSIGPMTGDGRNFWAIPPRVACLDIDFLKNDLHSLGKQLAQIEARIENLKNLQKSLTKGASDENCYYRN